MIKYILSFFLGSVVNYMNSIVLSDYLILKHVINKVLFLFLIY